ncbi:MAG: sigma-70 family RNA polymerase sigma factor [Thalassolituus sp.]
MTQDPSSFAPKAGAVTDKQLVELRRQMVAFATLQLSDAHLAEDAVQEALAGALKNAESFARQASLRTWVFAILKHKIADILRGQYRSPSQSSASGCKDCGSDDDEFSTDNFFDQRGHWQAGATPRKWGSTDQLVDDEQFWRVFDTCLEALPGEQGRVFMMREHIGLDAHEICNALELTSANLHVLLHRARLRLRDCLSEHWFAAGV